MTQLPNELHIPCWNLGYFAPTLRESKPQVDARAQLHDALEANDRGLVLAALHAMHLAYQRDVNGNHLPRRLNVTVVHVEQLIEMIEARDGAA